MASLNGLKIPLYCGQSTILPAFDFETYSEAGYVWSQQEKKWKSPPGSSKKGLSAVNTVAYAEHESTEVICLAYDLKDGNGPQQWQPGDRPPWKLFNYLIFGGLIEAFNVFFEYQIWNNVCVKKYDFPFLKIAQLRCAKAKAQAFALPPSLAKCGNVLKIGQRKMEEGARLLSKFSVPRKPTKTNLSKRVYLTDDSDSQTLLDYNIRDIQAQSEISQLIPDLTPFELAFWQADQKINERGVAVDLANIDHSIAIVNQVFKKYDIELKTLTGGAVASASEIEKLLLWINCELWPEEKDFIINAFYNLKELKKEKTTFTKKTKNKSLAARTFDPKKEEIKRELIRKFSPFLLLDLTKDTVEEALELDNLPAPVSRALEIRQLVGSAAIKKLFAFRNEVSKSGRLHNLFIYHSARTGRAAGKGPQPQNLPSAVPAISECLDCRNIFEENKNCVFCNSNHVKKHLKMNEELKEKTFNIIAKRDLAELEKHFKNPINLISGCLRSLIMAGPGCDLIGTDYSAIEAVVLACLAEEQWRIDVFNDHGKIYEMSASKITGVPFNDFLDYKKMRGEHHPLRKSVGKIAELASGYGGWVGAWKRFGADDFFTDEEMKKSILAWRKASPNIVKFWGGQPDFKNNNYYGLEGNAILAIMNPGILYNYKSISFICKNKTLFIILPSGRRLTYHNARLEDSDFRPGTLSIVFDGWNTNPEQGAIGWVTIRTYGGKLTENTVSAVARDILANGILNAEKNGYPIVLHVHDEFVTEVPKNFGSIEIFEKLVSMPPLWAKGWPVFARGGWRGQIYRKG